MSTANKSTEDSYLPLDCLKDNYIYEVKGRNFSAAVWKADKQRFYGVRSKWGDTYISPELHWDSDDHFGTVKPLREVGELEFDYCPRGTQETEDKLVAILEPLDNDFYQRQQDEFIAGVEELYGPIQGDDE